MARRSHAPGPRRWAAPALVALLLVASGCTTSEPAAGPPGQTSSPTSSPSTSPTSSPSTGPTEPPSPTASGYPSVATLDREMAREGLQRVPPSSWRPAQFRLASFNLLGATHTQGPDRRKDYPDADQRLPGELRALERARVTVAGLQEFQWPQARRFRELVGDRYAVFPGTSLGRSRSDNSIIWRTDVWALVRKRTKLVPYFHGHLVRMPQVLLRHRSSGRLVWFANFHNPADVGGPARRWRDQAVVIEAELVAKLGRTGVPVVVTGDMNARGGFACELTGRTGMHSADGAAVVDGHCRLPASPEIDWIFGTRALRFSHYRSDSGPERRHLTDHPLITATATLRGVEERAGCTSRISDAGVVWYCHRP
ncbi:endonuclease/exonuclease/phosphatase family protein [Nocardioides sp. URHA0020]|uniref:endonuclease/exonuclease/phosphatase family protein n=1 Tax=Nocardioides sp. URHA0020 TaxID=1380392 RepID=UPI0005664AED|nr:endonuclease/exonuclease/phosphatase family protein [Nocardioides sp. URHA0020]